ncbi:MAG: DNA mismatch repair endonuclease MutL [Chitinophagales bacterium]
MPDKIKLLPDTIANQIAAGEVIQRPASVVKELMENAIDSGATHVQLIVKAAGKTLVQVVDNGSGMSETDARMCFEKHATSKIRSIDDLFDIRTMGFRGEALASVAAIAQVEMRTRLHGQALGTCINIEGMKVLVQEPCQTAEGTSIAVKNLFFNVPARRNFLKSDAAELKNIIEEFLRIALSNPKVTLQFFSNEHEVFHYRGGNLKQRICAVFDDKYASQIVPVEENTYALRVYGFVGKPEFAKKTRGEQYIFVNNRFIKSPYLNHAIQNAYEQMLPKDSFPFYVLFLDIDPKRIDINVHPQKYEIKFDDEKLAYTFVNLAVKHALGAYSVMPSLDFNQEDHLNRNGTFQQVPDWLQQSRVPHEQAGGSTRDYFDNDRPDARQRSNMRHWENVYQPSREEGQTSFVTQKQEEHFPQKEATQPYQIHKQYIVSQIKSGFILIDQQAAHQRVLFERFIRQLAHNHQASQRQLFPQTIALNAEDAVIMEEVLNDINGLGFDIQAFGTNTFVIHSFPADIVAGDEKNMVEELLEQFKKNLSISKLNKRENLARSLAQSSSIKAGKSLSVEEMKNLIDELFACENPYAAPNGRRTIATFSHDEIEKHFEA